MYVIIILGPNSWLHNMWLWVYGLTELNRIEAVYGGHILNWHFIGERMLVKLHCMAITGFSSQNYECHKPGQTFTQITIRKHHAQYLVLSISYQTISNISITISNNILSCQYLNILSRETTIISELHYCYSSCTSLQLSVMWTVSVKRGFYSIKFRFLEWGLSPLKKCFR